MSGISLTQKHEFSEWPAAGKHLLGHCDQGSTSHDKHCRTGGQDNPVFGSTTDETHTPLPLYFFPQRLSMTPPDASI
jgi:hypothetical protein